MLSPPYNLTRTLLLAVAVVFGSLYPATAQSLTPSPDCTTASTVIDSQLAVWSFGTAQHTLKDTVWVANGVGNAATPLYLYTGQVVYVLGSGGSWYAWAGTGWHILPAKPVCVSTAPDPPPPASSARFAGFDDVTQGRWKGNYGALGISLYPDGGTMAEVSFARGVGTIQVQGMQFGGALTFDPRAPQRLTVNNCCDPVPYTDTAGLPQVVATGAPWPADARFAAGLYHRVADGVPMRLGVTLTASRRLSLYVVDFDRKGRSERIDVYAQGALDGDVSGSLGLSHANGPLLDSRVVDHFENGQYLTWDVTGPVIFQITALPTDDNTFAVESGLFLDAIPSGPPVEGCPQVEPIIRHAPAPIPQGSVFHVVADHDGLTCAAGVPAPIDSAACLLDGVTRIPAVITPAGTGLTLTCTPMGLSAGEHTAQVGVMNSAGENWSDVLGFTITAPAPPPIDCVLSEWTPWSPWALINATQEGRTRTRSVLIPAANGGMACPSPLLETETRAIAPPTPPTGIRIQGAVTVDGVDHPFTVTVP